MRLTFGIVRPVIANALNLKSSSERVADYANRVQERLMYAGKWLGTMARYRVCVNNACITWPRQIETIEAWAMNKEPGRIRNDWYEFLSSGPGIQECNGNACHTLIDRGQAVAFDDVVGSNKKLAIRCDASEDVTAKVTLQYYDSNGNWMRTMVDGTWIDGEQVALPAGDDYALTLNSVAQYGLVRVIKPVTNGAIRLFTYDTVNDLYKSIGYYEPDETIPVYRRSLIPSLRNCLGATCQSVTLDVNAKLRHIPVRSDADFMILEHIEAFRLGAQAIRLEEAHQEAKAQGMWALAEKCLEDQLRHYSGAGVTIPIRVENSATTTMAVPVLQ